MQLLKNLASQLAHKIIIINFRYARHIMCNIYGVFFFVLFLSVRLLSVLL